MATRSRIGLELRDGSILSVYHHWDGYPEWLGMKLQEHFNTKESVATLIDGGDMSSCWSNAGFNNETRPETSPLYNSERGEDCPPRHDQDLCDYLSDSEEYSYLFTENKWVCYHMHQFESSKLPEVVEIPLTHD